MHENALVISQTTLRRFILGQQGLYPGRRWQGQAGVAKALRAGCVVQVDPLNVVARSHDIALYGRVLDYRSEMLDRLLYTEREGFDYGGTVMLHPMEELPYWRVVMARKQNEPRWQAFASQHAPAIEAVRAALQARGPLAARDISGERTRVGSFRSGKDTGQALYYLWLGGELMTHSRRGFERVYALREQVAPAGLDWAATPEQAEDFLALKVFQGIGIASERSWHSWFAGAIERRVDRSEAAARLESMLSDGRIVQIGLEGELKNPRFLLAEELPNLEALHEGRTPASWQPLDTTTDQEMTFLAPLEIASARGRAQPLFGFEYLWEVYKPPEKRRWGYYTLPVLYGDRLVARLDPKLDRAGCRLVVQGFWLEPEVAAGEPFLHALEAAFKRFMAFAGADRLEFSASVPVKIRENLRVGL